MQGRISLGSFLNGVSLLARVRSRQYLKETVKVEVAWGAVLVNDLESRYGTFLGNNRLISGIPTVWEPGSHLC